MDTKIIVGSGWWCAESQHEWAIGTPMARDARFFPIWLTLVRRYLAPSKIVIVDSASPIKPDVALAEGVEWVELDRNYGHSNDIRTGKIITKHSGFMRSMILSACFALTCDADYFVYVEQDCVVHGHGLLKAAVDNAEHPIIIGHPTSGGIGINGLAAPMLQQSFVVVARAGLERFISSLIVAPESDGDLPPEEKFSRHLAPFSLLGIPYGRSRPIDFNAQHFYAQHLTDIELDKLLTLEGLSIGH
jgi:hypothetical protein